MVKAIIVISISLLSVVLSTYDVQEFYRRITVRCTRRYTPGTCVAPVVPVWTFEPHLQNCTQRLGCAQATVSNRFSSRSSCMKMCARVQELYLKYLIYEKNAADRVLRSRWNPEDQNETESFEEREKAPNENVDSKNQSDNGEVYDYKPEYEIQ